MADTPWRCVRCVTDLVPPDEAERARRWAGGLTISGGELVCVWHVRNHQRQVRETAEFMRSAARDDRQRRRAQ